MAGFDPSRGYRSAGRPSHKGIGFPLLPVIEGACAAGHEKYACDEGRQYLPGIMRFQ